MFLDDFTGAEADLVQAHTTLAAALPEDNRFVVLARESLRDLYLAWNEADPASGYAAKAQAWR